MSLGIVTMATAALALWPQPKPTSPPLPPPPTEVVPLEVPVTCMAAHGLVVDGQVTGGPSHVELAGPVIYSDVTTDPYGHFQVRVPVADDLCTLISEPASYTFTDGTMTVAYSITFE